MADYKDIVGTAVRNNAGNLSADQKNQIFYDSTNVDFKYQIEAKADAWRTTAPLNHGRSSGIMGGTKDSSWVAGGEQPTSLYPSSFTVYMELWNGSTWTEVNDLTTPKTWSSSSRGVPNNTTGLVFSGYGPPNPTGPVSPAANRARTEEWNGSNWTEVGDVNTARRVGGGAGTSAEACLFFGGYGPPSYANTELWNGSSWTETTDLNTARYGSSSLGSSTSALYMGASPVDAPAFARVESWNGSTWTEVNDMTNTDKNSAAGVNNTAGLAFGGMPEGHTERWNGTSWTETADFNTARYSTMGAGASSTSGIVAGGSTPGSPNSVSSVEEFVGDAPIGAWSSGGDLNTGRENTTGSGTELAALCIGGDTPSATAITESYNGSSWTEVNDLNTARGYMGGTGTNTSSLVYGGYSPATSYFTSTESWNGSTWTEVNDLNEGRYFLGRAGVSNTSALAISGDNSPPNGKSANTESWNGSSWTEVNNVNEARSANASNGTVTSALIYGGEPASAADTAKTEIWDGTSWTEVNDLNTLRDQNAGTGTNSNAALSFGGNTPPVTAVTEDWNGATWTEVADLSTARRTLAGSNTSTTAAAAFGGKTATAITAATEEWSGSSVTTKVLTD